MTLPKAKPRLFLVGTAFLFLMGDSCNQLSCTTGRENPPVGAYVSDTALTYIDDSLGPSFTLASPVPSGQSADSMVTFEQSSTPGLGQFFDLCDCQQLVYTSNGGLYTLSTKLAEANSKTNLLFPLPGDAPVTHQVDLGGKQAGQAASDRVTGDPIYVSLPSDAAVGVFLAAAAPDKPALDHLIPLPSTLPVQLAIPPAPVSSAGGATKIVGYALGREQVIAFSDSQTNGIVATAAVTSGAGAIAANNVKGQTFVAVVDEANDYVSIFDANLKLLGKANFDTATFSPVNVWVSPDGYAYVLCTNETGQGAIIAVNLQTFTLGAPKTVGQCPYDIKGDSYNLLWVSNNCDNTVSVETTKAGQITFVGNVTVGNGPTVIAPLDYFSPSY